MSVWIYPEGDLNFFFFVGIKSKIYGKELVEFNSFFVFFQTQLIKGTRNTKLEMLPLKKGAFHLAVNSQVRAKD